MKVYKLQEPVKSEMISFLDRRINRLQKRKKRNNTALGRLIDLRQLIEADSAINSPPVFIMRKIEELENERQPDGQLFKDYRGNRQ